MGQSKKFSVRTLFNLTLRNHCIRILQVVVKLKFWRVMMTLAELKKMFTVVAEKLNQFIDKSNFNEIEEKLKSKFKVKNLQDLPKEIINSYSDYKQAFLKLQSILEKMDFILSTYNEINSNDEIETGIEMSEMLKWYELISRYYNNFDLVCQIAERNQYFPGKLFFETEDSNCVLLSTDDFSDQLIYEIFNPIQKLLDATSGEFNLEKISEKLGYLKLDNLDKGEDTKKIDQYKKNRNLHINFAKDSYCSYFNNQQVDTFIRSTNNDPKQIQKMENFINDYLVNSGYSGTIEANLKALLSTLTNQGVFPFIPRVTFPQYFSLSSTEPAFFSFIKIFKSHFYFDQKNQLHIESLMDGSHRLINGTEEKQEFPACIKINLTIGINLIDNAPKFMINHKNIVFYFSSPKPLHIIARKEALKFPEKIPFQKRAIFPICMNYLLKSLDYHSLNEFYFSKKEMTEKLKSEEDYNAVFQLDIYDFINLAYKKSDDRKILSSEEYNFFKNLSQKDISDNSISDRNQIAEEICEFVYQQWNNNKVDMPTQARYIHWLNMAAEITGNKECWKKFKFDYAFFCNKFRDTPKLLIQLAQNDAQLYQEMVYPESVFDREVTLSDRDKVSLLAKHAILLQGNKGGKFLKLLNNFNKENKLFFIVKFVEYGNDLETLNLLWENLFDKKFIQWINKSANKNDPQVIKLLRRLTTNAPINALKLMRQHCKDAFIFSDSQIINGTIENILEFIDEIVDNNVSQRLGIDFLKQLTKKLLNCVEFSNLPEECAIVLNCSKRLIRFLAENPNFYNNEDDVDAFAISCQINLLYGLAQEKVYTQCGANLPMSSDESPVITSQPIANTTEKAEKDDTSSTTDEEELNSFINDIDHDTFDLREGNELAIKKTIIASQGTRVGKQSSLFSEVEDKKINIVFNNDVNSDTPVDLSSHTQKTFI